MRQRLSQKLEVGGSRLEEQRAQPRPGCPEQAAPLPGIFVGSRRESKNRIGMREPPPHPRVFWEKSPQSMENKGREVGKERQESSRVRKRLEGKEIEEVELMKEFKRGALLGWGAGETMGRRVFTSDDRTDYRSCQYLNWVLVFRDWAQSSVRARGVR